MLILPGFNAFKKKGYIINISRTDDDPIYVDHYDADALHEIQDTQHKITEYTKKKISRDYRKYC